MRAIKSKANAALDLQENLADEITFDEMAQLPTSKASTGIDLQIRCVHQLRACVLRLCELKKKKSILYMQEKKKSHVHILNNNQSAQH